MDNYELMTRDFKQILDDCYKLYLEKNAKYKRTVDPLSGFKHASSRAGISLPRHIYTRIAEKEGRLDNFFLDETLDVENMLKETEDIINYYTFETMALELYLEEYLNKGTHKSRDPFKKSGQPETV